MNDTNVEKCPSPKFIPEMLKEIGHIYQRKIPNLELRLLQ